MNAIRQWLRQRDWWVQFQELNREGWRRAHLRRSVQSKILDTPALRTSSVGATEIRVLTWRKDWINIIWAIKTFYYRAQVDYPLYIHDGGLTTAQLHNLARHFPDATVVTRVAADTRINDALNSRNLRNSIACRQTSIMARKFFDFYIGSSAERIISIDSDEIFFAKPSELLEPDPERRNVYNRDPETMYALPYAELCRRTGLVVPANVNAGLSAVWRESINFEHVDDWLELPGLMSSSWLVEQTLHALCGSEAGVRLLPSTYITSTEPGLEIETVAKHYPGFFRPLLYSEGMQRLIESGFIVELRRSQRRCI